MSFFRPPSIIVGASDMDDLRRPYVDFVCDGVADDVQIQAAIDSLPSTGGQIILSDGTFNLAAQVNVDKISTTIRGQ